MQNYRVTGLSSGFSVDGIMSFFSTCFDRSAITKDRYESYPFWAMIYTKKGRLAFRIGEEIYNVQQGELIFYPPDIPHSIASVDEKSWEVSFVTFVCKSERMEELVGKVFVPDGRLTEELQNLFSFGCPLFYNLPSDGDGTVGMYCSANEDQLFGIKIGLESVLTSLYMYTVTAFSDRSDKVFNKAVSYMNSHLGEHITLSHLAMETGVSVSTLKKIFHDKSGGGVNSYYIDIKLSRGADMLCKTDMSVGEISEKLGFSSQFYFSELFKKRYGQPPLIYRRQQENDCKKFL